jgi:hypothetical protein
MITPYYFAYEDLLEDWNSLTNSKPNVAPTVPSVVVVDFIFVTANI